MSQFKLEDSPATSFAPASYWCIVAFVRGACVCGVPAFVCQASLLEDSLYCVRQAACYCCYAGLLLRVLAKIRACFARICPWSGKDSRAHAGDVATMRGQRFVVRSWVYYMVVLVTWGGGSFFYIWPGTNRIPEGFWGFRKSYGGTGITIPVKKEGQERKKQESSGFLQELPT